MRNAPTTPDGTAPASGATGPMASSSTAILPTEAVGGADISTATDPAAAGVSTATTPPAEDLQAQMARLVDERLKASEEKLRKGYDEQIRVLRGQLDEARKGEPPAGTAPSAPTGATPPATVAPAPATAEEAAGTVEEDVPPATAEPAPGPTTPPPAPAPAPTVRLGDLVTMSAGVLPPRIGSELNPRYPTLARQTRRSAVVVVRVLVDENGKPIEVQLKDAKKVGLGFDEAALDAARRATYLPATKNGVRVKMWLDLNVKFVPD
jgi:TonB family protein